MLFASYHLLNHIITSSSHEIRRICFVIVDIFLLILNGGFGLYFFDEILQILLMFFTDVLVGELVFRFVVMYIFISNEWNRFFSVDFLFGVGDFFETFKDFWELEDLVESECFRVVLMFSAINFDFQWFILFLF